MDANVEGTRDELLARLERPSSERYDILLAAFRAGARAGGDQRADVHRHVVPAGAAGARAASRGAVSRRALATAPSTRARRSSPPRRRTSTPAGSATRTPRHEVQRGDRPSVVILGAGPNRIGQGIEFDYCCVHAAMTVRASGRDAVMINCNPETVSTDYDTSDRLYFEPLTLEDVLGVVEIEQPEGVIVQFGGQTPLKLAAGLQERGVPILGTSVDAIDLAEDRGRFGDLLDRLGYKAPPYATALGRQQALAASADVGFPLLVRPSYVLGGRAMEIVYDEAGLADYLARTAPPASAPPREIFLDRFLENAIELDVDALCDGHDVWIGGIMQHVEEAGIHSGDSACVLPPHSLGPEMLDEIRRTTRGIALALGTLGLINIQYAVYNGELYIIEANPARLADGAVRLQGDRRARSRRWRAGSCSASASKSSGCRRRRCRPTTSPSRRPCCRSTASPARTPCSARRCARRARSWASPATSRRRSPRRRRRPARCCRRRARSSSPSPTATRPAPGGSPRRSATSASAIVATAGTAQAIRGMGVRVDAVLKKIGEGSPNVADCIEAGDVDLIINTPTGSGARADGWEIRRAAVARGIPCITTLSGGHAAVRAIAAARNGRARGAVAAGDPPRPHGGAVRIQAPFGRRRVAVTGVDDVGAYRVVHAADPDGPAPWPGQFYMLATAERWGAGEDERPYVPRALSFLAAADGRAELHVRGRRPRHAAPVRARARRRAVDHRAARRGLRAAARGRARAARRRRRRHPAAVGLVGGPHRARDAARRRCSASATRSTRRRALRAARRTRSSRPTTARSATTASSPSCSPPSSTATRLRSSTRAARPRCSRPCARCAPAAACPRSSRSRRAWRAASARASAASCRSASGGYVRVCVDGPVLDAARLDTVPAH